MLTKITNSRSNNEIKTHLKFEYIEQTDTCNKLKNFEHSNPNL